MVPVVAAMSCAELSPATSLFELLLRLASIDLNLRIRLSSIEPRELTDDIIDLVADTPHFCHHFHVPLQSGDDGILSRMHRPYTAPFFRNKILTIHKKLPDAGIGIDVMAGFPGEDEPAFESSLSLLQALPLTYLHVFPFSPRQGTPAVTFSDKVHPQTIRERCARLRAIGRQKKDLFFRQLVGRTEAVLVEGGTDTRDGFLKGVSSNYARIKFLGPFHLQNSIVPVRIKEIMDADHLLGQPVSGCPS